MKRVKATNRKGFTIIESIISIVIIIIIISSITLSSTVAMQTNEAQRQRNSAQDIADDIISQVVRNDSFDVLYGKINLNLPGNFSSPFKLEVKTADLGTLITQDQVNSLNDKLGKISKNATAGIFVKPILTGTNISDPASFSKTKLSVTIRVNKDNDNGVLYETSTIVSQSGFFSKSAHTSL
jgi:type II secretory pathway pseudopilin PulG